MNTIPTSHYQPTVTSIRIWRGLLISVAGAFIGAILWGLVTWITERFFVVMPMLVGILTAFGAWQLPASIRRRMHLLAASLTSLIAAVGIIAGDFAETGALLHEFALSPLTYFDWMQSKLLDDPVRVASYAAAILIAFLSAFLVALRRR